MAVIVRVHTTGVIIGNVVRVVVTGVAVVEATNGHGGGITGCTRPRGGLRGWQR